MPKQQGNIVALGFDSLDGAEKMLANVDLFQDKGYFTVQDAVVVTRPFGSDKLQIKQTVKKKTGKWALGGGGIGFLAGMLLGGPIGGLVVGATAGAVSAALKDSGIDDGFIQTIGTTLSDDTSAIIVMVEPNSARNEEEFATDLAQYRAVVLSTSLSPEREQQLSYLLSGRATATQTPAPDPAVSYSEPISSDPEDAEPEAVAEASPEVVAEATPEIITDADPVVNAETTPEAAADEIPKTVTEAIPAAPTEPMPEPGAADAQR